MEPDGWGRCAKRWITWDDGFMTSTITPDTPQPGGKPIHVPSPELLQRAVSLRCAAVALSQLGDGARRSAVEAMADALAAARNSILAANQRDLSQAKADGLKPALVARLNLDGSKLDGAIAGMRQVANLADPVGQRQLHTELDINLVLERVSVPLGVLGVIFEARPDAVMQIAALAIRSGNGALLKGGREAQRSCQSIMAALHQGLASSPVAPACLDLLNTRQESLGLLKLDGLVDLIIPRGSNDLVRYIQDNTHIPVLGHADGICHMFIDRNADLTQALRLAIDSKTHYPAACNAIETLLVDKAIAAQFLPLAIAAFDQAGVELRGDEAACALGVAWAAEEADWSMEYSSLILSVKIVADLEEALEHIDRYGSRHTDAICTQDQQTAERFLAAVNSAGVFHNCSTRFADGNRYGLGAEVGISTNILSPRGPVGLEGLVTYRYRLRGSGQIAADYGPGLRRFSHRNLAL